VLDNAIKYSSDEGVIEVRCGAEGATARVEIRDYGIGIPPSDLPRVFDRLYRADPARNRASGGLGLGLSLVKWVIEAHGGSVRLWSEPDQGTLCTIELPVASGSPASSDGARLQPAKA
jgi:signal transduction histidine kinase